MANYIATDTDLTAVANAIRTKGGTSAQLTFPQGFVDAIAAISGGGGGLQLEDVLNRDVSGDIVLNITGQPTPTANAAGSQFYGLAFSALFQQCGNITGITVNGLKWVPQRFFCMNGTGNPQSNPALTSVSMPDAIFAGSRAFEGCINLVSASFPSLQYAYQNYADIASNMFTGCSGLTSVDIGNIDRVGANMFQNCSSLTSLELNAANYIYANAFSGATQLATLVIHTSSVATLANVNAFNNSPFASGKAGGTLYVPSSLIASYQAATNWSTILGYSTNNIVAIEGSEYE